MHLSSACLIPVAYNVSFYYLTSSHAIRACPVFRYLIHVIHSLLLFFTILILLCDFSCNITWSFVIFFTCILHLQPPSTCTIPIILIKITGAHISNLSWCADFPRFGFLSSALALSDCVISYCSLVFQVAISICRCSLLLFREIEKLKFVFFNSAYFLTLRKNALCDVVFCSFLMLSIARLCNLILFISKDWFFNL